MSFKQIVMALVVFAVPHTVWAQDETTLGLRGEITYGEKTAPVEVIEYGSFTCPHCGEFATEVFPQLKAEYIDNGQVRFVFRNFVRDRYDMAVAAISRCTTEPEKAKAMIAAFFERQKEWMTSENPYATMAEIAGESGVSEQALGECVSDRELQEHIVEMRTVGIETYEINSVPWVLVNGAKVHAHSYEELKEAIEAAK